MFTFRHSWPELYIFTQSIFQQRDSLFPQFCFHPVDPTNNVQFMYTRGEPHFEVHSKVFVLWVHVPLFATPQIFRKLVPCWTEVTLFFNLKTIVHFTVLGRPTKLARRQRSHPIWPCCLQLDWRQPQCYVIPCSKFQPWWWMECSGRVNTWECLHALLAQLWLYSKSRSIQLNYWPFSSTCVGKVHVKLYIEQNT